jgi:DtxR family Mn-dependent transcriptional regulator
MSSTSTEDYIKSIYRLQTGKQSVSTSILAKHLKIGDGSVTDMIKRLSEKKLIHYEPYQGVKLTEAGKRLALKMVRRHRLWEMFLVQYLGYRWDEIHDEAERLEHVTSEEMEGRLDKALGYPKVDPHGDPIPNIHGEFTGDAGSALAEFEEDDTVKILRVSDDNADILQHAAKLGLGLNKKIRVKKKLKFDGSMVVKVGAKEQFISEQVANSIFVELA